LFRRYPQTRLVWAANEQMAFGAMDALREKGGKPGEDVLFSAINGTALSLQAQLNGSLSAVATGHFTVGLGGQSFCCIATTRRKSRPASKSARGLLMCCTWSSHKTHSGFSTRPAMSATGLISRRSTWVLLAKSRLFR
ncbi:sugar ABC transporter substrate-binding protein, partial [Pseudomonas syringae pv. actinidifoliorum]|nr:sugar ABC transporter substrate-binding protein [Pseudomonas syringae pv. actinidifoliorum]